MTNVTGDFVHIMNIGGYKGVELSVSSNDHAVRYPDDMGYLDHLVVNTPVPVETDQGIITLIHQTRLFVGAVAVEAVVQATGLGEVYYNSIPESVYADYQEQELAKLDSELGDLEE